MSDAPQLVLRRPAGAAGLGRAIRRAGPGNLQGSRARCCPASSGDAGRLPRPREERGPRADGEGAATARGAGCRCSGCGVGLFFPSLLFCSLLLPVAGESGFPVRVLRAS